jgi:hypothetical protein
MRAWAWRILSGLNRNACLLGEAVYHSYYRIQNRGLRFVARVSLPTGVTDSSSIGPNRVHIEQL